MTVIVSRQNSASMDNVFRGSETAVFATRFTYLYCKAKVLRVPAFRYRLAKSNIQFQARIVKSSQDAHYPTLSR